MKRLFVAIKLYPDEHFLNVYYSLRKGLQHEKITWVEPEKIHITLKFIGQTTENHIADINIMLKSIAEKHYPFSFSLQSIGIFGSRYNPRVLWFGIKNGDKIKMLGEDILNVLDNAGFKRDEQNFVPHLTIGRIKRLDSKKYFQKIIDRYKTVFLQEVTVKSFTLYESVLKSSGPIYISLEHFYLRQPNN